MQKHFCFLTKLQLKLFILQIQFKKLNYCLLQTNLARWLKKRLLYFNNTEINLRYQLSVVLIYVHHEKYYNKAYALKINWKKVSHSFYEKNLKAQQEP